MPTALSTALAQPTVAVRRRKRLPARAVEIAHDVAPFRLGAGTGKPLVEFLTQDEGEERAEQVAGDSGIALGIDRAGFQDSLGGAEDRLDLQSWR